MSDKKNKNIVSKSNLSANGDLHIGDIIHIHKVKEIPVSDRKKLLKTEIEHLRILISKNKIKECLELILAYSKEFDKDLYTQAIQQSQRWNNMQKDKSLGLINYEEASKITNRLVYAILGIVNELQFEN